MGWIAYNPLVLNRTNKHYFSREISFNEWSVSYDFEEKFANDRKIWESENQFVLIDGVVLNSREDMLANMYGCSAIDCIYPVCSLLRGPFTGIHVENSTGRMAFFGNQTGDTTVFYYNKDKITVAATDINILIQFLKDFGEDLTFDTEAAKQMLSLGYLVDGHTFINEIKRTLPGEMIEICDGGVRHVQYHQFSNIDELDVSLEEAIEIVDKGFRAAVDRCFKKDKEYGYSQHLADMSGGLDSRMVNCVAKELGYRDITNISFAKNGSVEQQYSFNAAMSLGNEFIFKCLDDLHFIFDIDETLRMNNGLAVYIGITGGKKLLSDINMDQFGLEHTGMIGDVVIGSFEKNTNLHIPVASENIKNIFYNKNSSYIPNKAFSYPNYEMYAMYYRGFQSAVTSHYIRRKYTEAVSPFLDVDFLQLCLSIPIKYRANHKLYFAWIQTKYPQMLDIPTTHPNPNDKNVYNLAKKVLGSKTTEIKKMLRKFGLFGMTRDKKKMYAFDYWYDDREDIKRFMDGYFTDNIGLVCDYPEVFEKLNDTYTNYGAMNKFMALTVLGAYKLYFSK